jgi:glutamine synthetase
VNGSGKHNNWSLGTDNGVNLFKPGKEPNKNLQFLCVLACLMEAVKKHSLLLRAAASNAGNDHRLGANEAPPAIISIYMGDQLGEIVDAIVKGVPFDELPCSQVSTLDLGVSTLPVLPKDPTDRNRTSPFAFTGNRFEFRMVASSVSIGDANTVMNSMMAEAFNKACDVLEGAEDFEKATIDYIYKTMQENQDIVFNGNGYSEEWVEEAARRGLPNAKTIVDAIPAYVSESSVEMFEKLGVMTRRELEARKEIKLEEYAGLINIEARTMIDMASKLYIPAVISYVDRVASSMSKVKSACAVADVSAQEAILLKASSLLAQTQKALDTLKAVTEKADSAASFHDTVLPAMDALRAPIDELETIVDRDYWPVPTYGELMFEV